MPFAFLQGFTDKEGNNSFSVNNGDSLDLNPLSNTTIYDGKTSQTESNCAMYSLNIRVAPVSPERLDHMFSTACTTGAKAGSMSSEK